jgi:hypothetical protein
MHTIVDFTYAEIATAQDWSDIGIYGRDAVDGITGTAIGWPNHWGRMTVTQDSTTEISITAGELYDDGVVYRMGAAETIDLQTYLPVIATDDRWVAIIARPATVTDNALRSLETGEQPLVESVPVETSLPKLKKRYVTFVIQAGPVGPAAQIKPVINAGDTAVAYIRVTTAGIQEIVPGETWRVKSVYELDGRVTVLEGRLDATIQRTATLETDLANIAVRLNDIPRVEVIRQMQRDIGATRRLLDLPDTARAYWYDNGLLQEPWDKLHVDWLARVREGVRFGYAQIVDAQLALATPADPKLTITGNMALPKHTEEIRLEVDGTGGSKDISDQVHTVTTAIQRTASGTSISYGPSFAACENTAGWSNLSDYARTGATFNVNGQSYISSGLTTGSLPSIANGGAIVDVGGWNASPASEGHKGYTVQSVQYDTWSYTYWEYHTEEFGVNGSIYGQTFLWSQSAIATSIELKFTRAAETGNVHLFICETSETGAPQFSKVIASSELAPEDISVGWVRFPLAQPTLFEPGKRYAWYTVTVGNHAIATVSQNKFAQGSLFWATDGIWAQGDNLLDFCFRVNTAKFEATRTVLEFNSLSCPDGMSELQLLYSGFVPAGTSISWEVKPTGDDTWYPILTGDPTPLNGLPALVNLRATFIGTTDLAPAIKLDNTARGVAMRVRTSAVAVTDELALGVSSETIVTVTTLDNFDPAYNTFTPRIMDGSTVIDADATEVEIDYFKPTRRTVTATFDLTGSAVTAVKVRPEFTTSNVLKACFVQDQSMHAL